MDAAGHPGMVILDPHLDPWPWFGLCIASCTMAFRRRNR